MIVSYGYSIPDDLLEETEASTINKSVADAPLVPGKKDTYIYEDEKEYNDMYRSSKFAVTKKGRGWDNLRHYEILGNKCIPLFENLDKCPANTMTQFPKDMIRDLHKKKLSLLKKDYQKQSDVLFNYCKEKLKTSIAVSNLMKQLRMKLNDKSKILFLSGSVGYKNVNYNRELLAYGLKKLYGANVVDYPKIKVLYQGCENLHKYEGNGFTYGGKIVDEEINRDDIEKRIQKKEFDLIIYGKVGNKDLSVQHCKELKYWDTVHRYYTKEQLIFVYGGENMRDREDPDLIYHSHFGHCIVKELC